MSLFINKESHQNLFQNSDKIEEPNQRYFHQNYLSELLKEQQKSNHLFHQSILEIKTQTEQQEVGRIKQWNSLSKRLHGIEQKNDQIDKNNSMVVDQLQRVLEDFKQIQSKAQHGQEIKDQIKLLEETNEIILKQLESFYELHDEIKEKINAQNNKQQEMITQLSVQGVNQQELSKRLDNQEALLEKLMRKMEYIRSTIFERTVYLAEKIENGYFITSSFIAQLITGSPNISNEMRRLDRQKKK